MAFDRLITIATPDVIGMAAPSSSVEAKWIVPDGWAFNNLDIAMLYAVPQSAQAPYNGSETAVPLDGHQITTDDLFVDSRDDESHVITDVLKYETGQQLIGKVAFGLGWSTVMGLNDKPIYLVKLADEIPYNPFSPVWFEAMIETVGDSVVTLPCELVRSSAVDILDLSLDVPTATEVEVSATLRTRYYQDAVPALISTCTFEGDVYNVRSVTEDVDSGRRRASLIEIGRRVKILPEPADE